MKYIYTSDASLENNFANVYLIIYQTQKGYGYLKIYQL